LSGPLIIGNVLAGSSYPMMGYIDEVRISNVARYTTNFTPYNVAFFTDITGSTNFVYDAANDWFSPSLTSGTPNNMTLLSVNYSASAVPSTARVAVQLADTLALTPNADFTMEVSRDGGNTFSALALALTMPLFGGVKMYEGTVSLTGQPSGTLMAWRFKTLTNKNIIASGVVLQQS